MLVASKISVILLAGLLKGRPLELSRKAGTPEPEKSGPADAMVVAPIAMHLADDEPSADLHLSLSLFNPLRGRNEGCKDNRFALKIFALGCDICRNMLYRGGKKLSNAM